MNNADEQKAVWGWALFSIIMSTWYRYVVYIILLSQLALATRLVGTGTVGCVGGPQNGISTIMSCTVVVQCCCRVTVYVLVRCC